MFKYWLTDLRVKYQIKNLDLLKDRPIYLNASPSSIGEEFYGRGLVRFGGEAEEEVELGWDDVAAVQQNLEGDLRAKRKLVSLEQTYTNKSAKYNKYIVLGPSPDEMSPVRYVDYARLRLRAYD